VPEQVLAIHEALDKLARDNPPIARLVELRYFAGLSAEDAAFALGVSTRTAQRYWVYAKAWLLEELRDSAPH
jgi:DNA-directed RNA polymerase specialized sigma24 family protein